MAVHNGRRRHKGGSGAGGNPTDISLTWKAGFELGLVPEDTATSTVLADIAGTDPDMDDLIFVAAAESDTHFAVVGTTLVLATALDYETATSHAVIIRAIDLSAKDYRETFTVTVDDVEEGGGGANVLQLGGENLQLGGEDLTLGV